MSLPAPAVVVVQFIFALTAYSLVAKWWVYPALKELPLRAALPPLLLIHLVRPVSLWLLSPGAIVAPTIPPAFATGTAVGDLISAGLALTAVLLIRADAPLAVPVTWLFNVVGMFDVLRNCAIGVATQAPAHMGAMAFVPAYGVPVIIVTHCLLFALLLKHRRAAAHEKGA